MYILDLIGVFAFAFFGAVTGLKRHFNLLGTSTCAFLTALGGGTIRALLLDQQPAYFHDSLYLIILLFGIILAIITEQHLKKITPLLLLLDAIGLVTFAYIGANAASQAGLGLPIIAGFAVLTAAGGGMMSDLIAGKSPHVFRDTAYVVPALALAGSYWALGSQAQQVPNIALLLMLSFLIRLGFLYTSSWRSWLRGGYARTKQMVAFSFK